MRWVFEVFFKVKNKLKTDCTFLLVENCWIVGNNPDFELNTNEHNKSRIATILDIFSNKRSSSHNCYGLGQDRCFVDGYRKENDRIMHPEKTVYDLINPKK